MRIALFLLAFALTATARQQEQKPANDESRWAVPNVSYTCVARLFQDWARGNGGSIGAKTKQFTMNMRTAPDFKFTAKDFELNGDSEVKSMADTDLAASSIWVKLNAAGENGVSLQVFLSTQPEGLNKEVMMLGEESSDSVVTNLGAHTRLWVGNREDLVRNGPISASVDCKLKSLFR